MEKEKLAAVFQRYLDNQYNRKDFKIIQDHFQKEGDRELMISWIKDELENEEFSQEGIEKTNEVLALAHEKLFERINQTGKLRETTKDPIIKSIGFKIAIAASIILIAAASLFYFNPSVFQDSSERNNSSVLDIAPGGNRATLTLADGSTVDLSDTQEGIIISDNSISYQDGSAILESRSQSQETRGRHTGDLDSRVLPLASITTPKGGKYLVTLPDGTKVWLNAASTLKYPNRFSGPDRKVELTGEAFFEVAKNNKQPFIVKSIDQEIKVLGTSFNINAYGDEATTSTTLIEGSVQVNTPDNTLTITPGQQSVVDGTGIQVKAVNTSEYTAWRENLLIFEQKSLKSILLTLSRWYNFQVDHTQIPDVSLSGAIPTSVNFSEVITLLEETSQVKLKIESMGTNGERRVTIKK